MKFKISIIALFVVAFSFAAQAQVTPTTSKRQVTHEKKVFKKDKSNKVRVSRKANDIRKRKEVTKKQQTVAGKKVRNADKKEVKREGRFTKVKRNKAKRSKLQNKHKQRKPGQVEILTQ